MASSRVEELRSRRTPTPLQRPISRNEFMEASYSEKFPLVEDEFASWVLGYGHVDKVVFARLVNTYDYEVAGVDVDESNCYTVENVWHGRAVCVARKPDLRYRLARLSDPPEKTFPVTGIYR